MTALLAMPATALGASRDISTVAGNGASNGLGDNGAATSASLVNPLGVAAGPDGAIYIADYSGHKVRKVSAAGTITTFAGDGTAGLSGDGGAATSARLRNPSDIAVDALGNVYISDSLNHRIRVVSPGGTISTFAGTTQGFLGDTGVATAARLDTPQGVDVDAAGNVYVADYNNDRVRKISGGTITTIAGTGSAGSGGDGGPATSATLNAPSGVAVDHTGVLYIAEYDGNRVRKVATNGTITRFAGTGGGATSGDGGWATDAQLDAPWGVETDTDGNVYVTEIGGHVTRKVSWFFGIISRFAGTGSSGFSGDGGTASSAQLNAPGALALSSEGHMYLADYTNRRVRRIEAVVAPSAPTVSAVSPTSPANSNTVNVTGTAASGTTVRLYTNSSCSSTVAGTGTAAAFGSTGVSATVADNSTTTFYATASNADGASSCSSTSVTYVEDSIAPAAPTVSSEPTTPGNSRSPSWSFSGEGGGTLECQLVGPNDTWAWESCTAGAKSYDLTGKADGTYAFSVRAKDAANNTGTPATGSYTLDTTAPPDPSVNAPASPSSDATPNFTFSASGATGYECRVERPGPTLVDDWAACSSPWEYSLGGKPDDVYTVKVRSRDAVGNRSTGTSVTYTIDRALPATPTIDTTPGALGRDTTPEWSFSTSESGMTFECRLMRGATQIDGWGDCLNPKGYSLTTDGTYTFSVRAKNGVNTRSAPASHDYELDTTAPAAPSIGSEPSAIGSGRSPTWSYTVDSGATPRCRVDRGGTEITGWANCPSPHVVDLTGADDGTYTLTLLARDPAGNESTTTTRTYELDSAGPAAPDFTGTARTPGNVRQPQWSWSGAGTFECSLARPNGSTDDWAACTSPAIRDLGGQPDGRYELRVRGVDTAGNRGAVATAGYELDTQPGALALTGGPAPTSKDQSATFTWTGEAGASYRCRILRGGDVRTDWSECSSPHAVDMAGDPDGAYSLAVVGTDAAGNATPDAVWNFAIDRTAPAAAVYDATPPARARDRTPEWTFAGDPGVRYECRVEQANSLLYDWRDCVSPLRVDLRESDDGVYSLLVRAIDEAGNVATPVETSYRLDTTDPEVPELTDKPGSTGVDRTPTWAFRAEARAEVECRLKQDGKDAPEWRVCESPKTYDLESKDDDAYTFYVRARDVAGNTGQPTSDVYRLRTPAAAGGGSGGGGDSPTAPGADPTPGPAAAAPAPAATAPEPNAPASDDPDAGDDEDDAAGTEGAGKDGKGAAAGGPGAGKAAGPGGPGAQGAGGESGAGGEEKDRETKGNPAQETFKKVGKVVAAIAEEPAKTAFPMSLIFVVTGFMGLQGRIDRNDPKLALAPVFADPDLEFRSPHDARAALGDQ